MTEASGTAVDKPPRQLLGRDERRAQLLRAAAAAFAREGFAATSMEDVGAEAGVTKLIVYRHFASKEELYRAVLTQVSRRLHDEFLRGLNLPEPERHGFMSRSILIVAREDPDGFRLLTTHAAREVQFAELSREFAAQGLHTADLMIADMIPDPTVKRWAAKVIVSYLVEGVLAWLESGDPARDDEFVELATQGLRAMFLAWADHERLPDSFRRPTEPTEPTVPPAPPGSPGSPANR